MELDLHAAPVVGVDLLAFGAHDGGGLEALDDRLVDGSPRAKGYRRGDRREMVLIAEIAPDARFLAEHVELRTVVIDNDGDVFPVQLREIVAVQINVKPGMSLGQLLSPSAISSKVFCSSSRIRASLWPLSVYP